MLSNGQKLSIDTLRSWQTCYNNTVIMLFTCWGTSMTYMSDYYYKRRSQKCSKPANSIIYTNACFHSPESSRNILALKNSPNQYLQVPFFPQSTDQIWVRMPSKTAGWMW